MSTPLLNLRKITAAYGPKIVLQEVSLEIGNKDFIIICGPNGGGKTTLLKTIAGLIKPTQGCVEKQKGLITGYLPQYRGIDRDFPITVAETVLSGLNCRKSAWAAFTANDKEKVEELLATFHLSDLGKCPINSLSGGQWQRTLLARSLAGNPDLWLLDEPDTHLDVESQQYLHQRIAKEVGKRAIVVVTHSVESLSFIPPKRIIHVEDQRLTELE